MIVIFNQSIMLPTDIYMFWFVTLSRFHALFWCFHCWLWSNKYQLELHPMIKQATKVILYKISEIIDKLMDNIFKLMNKLREYIVSSIFYFELSVVKLTVWVTCCCCHNFLVICKTIRKICRVFGKCLKLSKPG